MTWRPLSAVAVGVLIVTGCTAAKAHPVTVATSAATGPASTGKPSTADAPSGGPASPGGSAAALAASPAATPSAAALSAFYRQKLTWKSCGGGFSCTHADVPLDYSKPGAKRIQISMIKLPARKTSQRIGSLFINPGGPGGSGIGYARYAESAIPRGVRDRFDIVGFDPRGVGESSPVRCATGAQLDSWLAVDPSPDDSRELQAFVSMSKAFAAGCQQRSRVLLAHVGTRDSARDLDVMRAAVGDDKLTFLGKSYGTYLGALYADMFPQRVRALVLDGAVDPTIDTQALGRVQAQGFEVALTAFLDNCAKTSSCAFGKTPDIRARFDALLARIERQPLATPSGRTVGPDAASIGVAEALYSRQYGWPVLRQALSQAETGDGSGLLLLFDSYTDRDAGGSYSNLLESYTAISCIDRPSPTDLATYQADARRQATESPHFGAASAFSGLPCAYWPVPPVDRPRPLKAHGAPAILVIGTTRDPATPLVWARALASQLESGRLLTFNGDGHTVYGDGDSCVDKAGNSYLIDLVVPASGKRCG
ncbi:MAG: alpha/beta hydrolase [Actinomycetota bacterium]